MPDPCVVPPLRGRALPRLVLLAVMALLVAALAPVIVPAAGAQGPETSIFDENQRPGSESWAISRRGSDAGMEIKGFMSASSVDVGESIDYHISVSEPQDVTIEVYRMGWYGGSGGRLVTTIGPLDGETKAAPTVDPVTGMVTTDWAADHTLQIPADWTTGVYVSRLVRADGFDGHTIFVLRHDDRAADFIVQIPVTTYQAYNGFPADGATGKSLYDYNSFGPDPTGGDGSSRAIAVSFDRPYEKDGAGQYFLYDHGVVTFLEREGYDVAYVTNLDPVEAGDQPDLEAFISSGHDEYWAGEMYDRAEDLRDAGIDLAFLGANAVYWRIDMAPSTLDGRADRVIVAPKDRNTDLWRVAGRPEQGLIGVQYISPFSYDFTPLVVQNADHWAWANTGLSDGDEIPDMVGYEIDTVFGDAATPPGPQTLLSASPFQGNTQHTSIYQADSGAWVFGSGTINWNRGLGHPWYPQQERAAIQQVTRNLLARFADDDWNVACDGQPVTVRLGRGEQPTDGDDVILGTLGGDIINGLDGNDTICGLTGHDAVRAGNGNDLVIGGPGDDVLRGGRGRDDLRGGDGDDTLKGASGRDTIQGGAGNDAVIGGRGSDTLSGGPGADHIYGWLGNDSLDGGEGDDMLNGGSGRDTCDGGPGADTLRNC